MDYTSTVILLAAIAQVFLTFSVGIVLYIRRISELKTRRISPQKIATSSQSATIMEDTRASDNFKNLFEVPVLFYFLCSVILITKKNNEVLALASIIFVILRAVHSYIQCTSNRVMIRFYAFCFSSITLIAAWLYFTFLILI